MRHELGVDARLAHAARKALGPATDYIFASGWWSDLLPYPQVKAFNAKWKAAAADPLIASYNDLASVHRVFDANRGQIAALIVEPRFSASAIIWSALDAFRASATANLISALESAGCADPNVG